MDTWTREQALEWLLATYFSLNEIMAAGAAPDPVEYLRKLASDSWRGRSGPYDAPAYETFNGEVRAWGPGANRSEKPAIVIKCKELATKKLASLPTVPVAPGVQQGRLL